jgi:hypothetical protein
MKKLRILLSGIVKDILRGGMSYVNSQPSLRQYAVAIIQRLGLYSIARAIYSRVKGAYYRSGKRRSHVATPADLSPRARHIYADLKTVIEHRQRKNG